jgi:hypothetical protein
VSGAKFPDKFLWVILYFTPLHRCRRNTFESVHKYGGGKDRRRFSYEKRQSGIVGLVGISTDNGSCLCRL